VLLLPAWDQKACIPSGRLYRHPRRHHSEVLRARVTEASSPRMMKELGYRPRIPLMAVELGTMQGHELSLLFSDTGCVCSNGLCGNADKRHPEAESPGLVTVGEEPVHAARASLL
jgi:hypothetical protein